MNFDNLLWDNQNGVLVLTINRPEKLNALNLQTVSEIEAAFHAIYQDDAVKGVILTGSGAKAFVAGADISEFLQMNQENGQKFAANGQRIFALIENCPKPVIAAVNGFALGGGCELAMACHIRVASANAKFGQPEVNLGIIPGYGGTQRLTLLVGKGRAAELMMTADIIDANEAHRIGLVNHVAEQVVEKAKEILHKILSKAPVAIAQLVGCINAVEKAEDGYQVEAQNFGVCCATEDFQEGASAFLNKRKPEFKGK